MIIFRVTTGRSWTSGIHKTLTEGVDDGAGNVTNDLAFARSRVETSDSSQEEDYGAVVEEKGVPVSVHERV